MVHRRALVALGWVDEALPGDGDDGGHHQVDRDDVGDPFGHAGELPQQAPGVGDDDRLRHAEASDPARAGLGERRLDDRRPDDGHGEGVAELRDECPLSQCLRIGIGVGPPERLGSGLAHLDHLLLDPVLPQSFRPLGQQMQAGAAQFPSGLLVEPGQAIGAAGLGLGVAALAAGGPDLGTPVHLHAEGVGVQQLLFGLTLVGSGHVSGGDRDEVDRAPAALLLGELPGRHRGRRHPRGPEEIDLDGSVEWRVEAHRCRRVDHDVAIGEFLEPVAVEAEAVGSHVAGDRRYPRDHVGIEPLPVLLAEPVEAVVLHDLLGGPLHGGGTAAGSDEEHDLTVGDGPQEALDQGSPQEAGGTGDEEAFAGQGVADAGHRICLPYGK